MTVELRNVSKKVGSETFIYETSMQLDKGKFNVLLGATNAGKTTLIKLLAGLEKPTTGSIWLNGEDVTKHSPQKRNISLVHQFFINYPHMSVYENIASPLRVAKMSAAEIDKRVKEAAGIMQLTPMLKRYPQELSGGQQQRTALARAVVKESSVVLLDEPLANLDYKLREELRDQLPGLFADRGTIVVYATSEPTEALLLGGNTITMHEGRVTQTGNTSSIYHRPENMTTARVFSDPPINITEVTKQGDRIKLSDQVSWQTNEQTNQLEDGAYFIGVRPHHVSPRQTQAASVDLHGMVKITEISGSDSVAHFEFDDHVWVSLTDGVYPYQINTAQTFYLDPSQCLYFDTAGQLVA